MACIASICNAQIKCTELIFSDDMTDKQKSGGLRADREC